ncbi:MAG: type II toxin-antitoxin system PemK/MazF family toxin [Leptolyngbyaceae cyanobacterium]
MKSAPCRLRCISLLISVWLLNCWAATLSYFPVQFPGYIIVIVVIITSNIRLAEAPGNVLLPRGVSGLSRDSVVNVSQIFTIDKTFLVERIGSLPDYLQEEIDEGLRTVLYL